MRLLLIEGIAVRGFEASLNNNGSQSGNGQQQQLFGPVDRGREELVTWLVLSTPNEKVLTPTDNTTIDEMVVGLPLDSQSFCT